jgi:hypothetical protein
MTEKTIPPVEEKIYKNLNFNNELLKIDNKYNNNNHEQPYFKLNEVKAMMKTIGYPYNYSGENSHGLLLRSYNQLNFKLSFFLKNNTSLPYLTILKNGNYFGPKFTNLYWLLNELPYDESLLNPNFRVNTLQDLKNYILDIIELCNKFIDEYIKEIEAGNLQE